MLEIINGFLVVYFVILCTLSAIVPILVKPVRNSFCNSNNLQNRLKHQNSKH